MRACKQAFVCVSVRLCVPTAGKRVRAPVCVFEFEFESESAIEGWRRLVDGGVVVVL